MNRETAKDYLPLVQALVDGKEIQYRYQKSDKSYDWMSLESAVDFCMPADYYRIKPEPREKFFVRSPVSGHELGPFDNETHARIYNADGRQVVRYREVLE